MMEGSRATGEYFRSKTGLRAPVVIGTMELAAAWGMEVYPWTVIVGRDGKPRYAIRGIRNEAQLREAFERYL